MRRQFPKSIVPADLLKFARTSTPAALERIGDTVWMIEHLQRGMASRAKFAAVDGVFRIAFELFRQAHFDNTGAAVAHDFSVAFHHSHERAATGITQSADARFPGRDSRN